MQYLLTQEEYDALLEKARRLQVEHKKQLQELCTRVANELPIAGWHAEYSPKHVPDPAHPGKWLAPWGCILTKSGDWYCDSCPAQAVCPHHPKKWSK